MLLVILDIVTVCHVLRTFVVKSWFHRQRLDVVDVYPFLTAASTLKSMAATCEHPSPNLNKKTEHVYSHIILLRPTMHANSFTVYPAMQVQ